MKIDYPKVRLEIFCFSIKEFTVTVFILITQYIYTLIQNIRIPEKWSPRKMVLEKNGPRETEKRKIVGLASSIVVCVCVCVECSDVINL